MTADVVITPPSRTYRVPMALTASIGKEQATLDDVFDALESNPAARGWAEKIINGVQRDETNRAQTLLASIGYDPETYLYWGFTASADDDFVFAIARCAHDDLNLAKSEQLVNGEWKPVPETMAAVSHGVSMDRELLAFTASAFKDGCRGVYLVYGEPVMFFPEQPLLAAGPPDAIGSEGHVYAVVDGTDTTAIMDVIMIKPGPEVYRRDAGSWVVDNATLDSLMGVQPPPMVELEGDTLNKVLEQVDMVAAQQVQPDSEGGASEGQMLEVNQMELDPKSKDASDKMKTDVQKEKKANQDKRAYQNRSHDTYKSNQDKSQLKDGSTAQAVVSSVVSKMNDANFEAQVASGPLCPERVKTDAVVAKKEALSSLLAASNHLRGQIHAYENVFLPALTSLQAAGTENTSVKNKKGAAHLKKYWLRGVGAAKIAWNTPGDFTRCTRQLRKYLSEERVKRTCAQWHKEATGVWPGDKRNK
ncbi:hypothetical protein PP304_gp070 [Gordonia phage Phendrix]|uniref:Capsid maturation protease n=1 Tax=Gordonia phage Phendrix TaxID=2593335 RepID=A0A514U103_9CAUD|nr:hypothetical protein PP304_gp070 [Gordonia phage Phendrix]QDK02618.1 hypothetical protein SEA_PHENDRIX_70 [Gordonia phage Phendrix]